jgi:hypothetical protein
MSLVNEALGYSPQELRQQTRNDTSPNMQRRPVPVRSRCDSRLGVRVRNEEHDQA